MVIPSAVDCTSFLISVAARIRARTRPTACLHGQDALHLEVVIPVTASPTVGGAHWRAHSAARLPYGRSHSLGRRYYYCCFTDCRRGIGAHTPPAVRQKHSTWMPVRLLAVGISGDDPTLSEVSHRYSFRHDMPHGMLYVALHGLFVGDVLLPGDFLSCSCRSDPPSASCLRGHAT